ncbi:hypothetical protein CAL12_09395 [Bordetella genomosp. 8]|uniref:Uncharacterized protein n=1 Tax=Bordetella genomosp. 8 TaxID=1416806 RepID=A0A1W6YIZ0_9BORD|nr:hypothetical protein [Bordetella genomosp. 8]ARP81037.1 hypothetical protein CAL12_09395 [Bordetella genomosp. 8]
MSIAPNTLNPRTPSSAHVVEDLIADAPHREPAPGEPPIPGDPPTPGDPPDSPPSPQGGGRLGE